VQNLVNNVSWICFMFRLCIACQCILHNPQILQFEESAANILKHYRQVQPEEPGLSPPRSQKKKNNLFQSSSHFTGEQVRYRCNYVLLSSWKAYFNKAL